MVIFVITLTNHNRVMLSLSGTSFQQLKIDRSDSLNHHSSYPPRNAHDGNYKSLYSVKDGSMPGNYLKLYLSRAFSITTVRVTSRRAMENRMENTEGKVYSTAIEIEVASCGKITGNKNISGSPQRDELCH